MKDYRLKTVLYYQFKLRLEKLLPFDIFDISEYLQALILWYQRESLKIVHWNVE